MYGGDRVYLIQIMLAQGRDAEVDLHGDRQAQYLAVWFL